MFKKREKINTDLIKTLTILDSETSEVKEIIDIVEDPVKEITLVDEKLEKYSETQLKDMSFMSELRGSYPDMEDMETFLTDACKSRKLEKDKDLSDEQKLDEQKKLDAIAKADAERAKLLLDEASKAKAAEKTRQNEIEEAERARHAAAQI